MQVIRYPLTSLYTENNEPVEFKGIEFDNWLIKIKRAPISRGSFLPARIIFWDSVHHQFS